jgi:hypothetical protein
MTDGKETIGLNLLRDCLVVVKNGVLTLPLDIALS